MKLAIPLRCPDRANETLDSRGLTCFGRMVAGACCRKIHDMSFVLEGIGVIGPVHAERLATSRKLSGTKTLRIVNIADDTLGRTFLSSEFVFVVTGR